MLLPVTIPIPNDNPVYLSHDDPNISALFGICIHTLIHIDYAAGHWMKYLGSSSMYVICRVEFFMYRIHLSFDSLSIIYSSACAVDKAAAKFKWTFVLILIARKKIRGTLTYTPTPNISLVHNV